MSSSSSNNEPAPIKLSPAELSSFFSEFASLFVGKETEQDWEDRDKTLHRLRAIARVPGIGREPTFQDGLKCACDALNRTMHTLRTTLALTCCSTVVTLSALGSSLLDPHLEQLLTNLLKLTTNTKKLVATAACTAIESLLKTCTPIHLRNISLIESRGSEKNPAGRVAVCNFLRLILEESMGSTWNAEALEKSGGLEVIERGVKRGLTDASPVAREQSRAAWGLLKEGWPDRAEKLLDSLDPTTRKGVVRGLSASHLPVLSARLANTAAATSTATAPEPAHEQQQEEEEEAGNAETATPMDPASPEPRQVHAHMNPETITADLASSSPDSRNKKLDAFLSAAKSGQQVSSESFLPVLIGLLKQDDSLSTKCLEELPMLLQSGLVKPDEIVSGVIGSDERLKKKVAEILGVNALDPLLGLLASPTDSCSALAWISQHLVGLQGTTDKLVPSLAPLALINGNKQAVGVLAQLRERDRWNYERVLRLCCSGEEVRKVQDLCDGDDEDEEERAEEAVESKEEVVENVQPSPKLISSPELSMVSRRTTRGRKSEFFRPPPATPTDSDGGTPDFRARIGSLAPLTQETPSDAGSPVGLPPLPGSALLRTRESLPPLPNIATPFTATTRRDTLVRNNIRQESPTTGQLFGVQIDERKFRLSMSFANDDVEDGEEGQVWNGNTLGDELDAAGWDGIMDEELPDFGSGEQSRRQSGVQPRSTRASVVPTTARNSIVPQSRQSISARQSLASDPATPRAVPMVMTPASPEESEKGTPRSQATAGTPRQRSAVATPSSTTRSRELGGMVSATPSRLVVPGTPVTQGTTSAATTPGTPFMRAEMDAVRIGAAYREIEGQRRQLFEQQTPVPDRAAPDDVLPRLVAKLSSNEQLESSEWRRLIRLSDDTRRKGAAVWGPWMEEVVQGVAEVWRRVSLERKEKGTNTKEQADAAIFPIFFFLLLVTNQTELLRSTPYLTTIIACFFEAFDDWGTNVRMQGLQAVAYKGTLTCLRKLNAWTLATACLDYLDSTAAANEGTPDLWQQASRSSPVTMGGGEEAHPLWAALKVLALSLLRIRDSASRSPSYDKKELDTLINKSRSWMVKGLHHPHSLVRMASTDVGIVLFLMVGPELLEGSLVPMGAKMAASMQSSKKNLIKCAVGLYETGKWNLGFASLGESSSARSGGGIGLLGR